jgi:hypothetical protein
MDTLTSYLLNNPTALIFAVPFVILVSLIIYIVSFPAPRPVQSRRADKFHPSKVPTDLVSYDKTNFLLAQHFYINYKILSSGYYCDWIWIRWKYWCVIDVLQLMCSAIVSWQAA